MNTNAKHLLDYLKLASPVIKSNPVVPILENFLLKSVDGKLQVIASNMNDVIIVKTDIEFNKNICVPAELFTKLLQGIGDKPITLDINEETFAVTVKSGKSKSKMSGENWKDFPVISSQLDNSQSIQVEYSLLETMNTMASFCGNDEVRVAMTGINFAIQGGKLELCATDGHRLLVENPQYEFETEDFSCLIPSRITKALVSSFKNRSVTITASNMNIAFDSDVVTIISRLIDGRYPDYRNVIPKDNDKVATLINGELSSALSRVMLFANKTTHQVRLSFKENELLISAEDLDYSNESSETVDLIGYDGEPLEIGFNGRLLSDVLKVLDSSVRIELSVPNRAGLFYSDGNDERMVLLMPVMLNQYA